VLPHSMQARKSVNGFFAICHLPFAIFEGGSQCFFHRFLCTFLMVFFL